LVLSAAQEPMFASFFDECAEGKNGKLWVTLVKVPSKNWVVLCPVNLLDDFPLQNFNIQLGGLFQDTS
jgi:hypothetical protein